MDEVNEITEQRKSKIRELKAAGVNPFPNDFKVTHTVESILETVDEPIEKPSEDGPFFQAAGRIMAVNRFGKTTFVRFRDRTGQMQAYVRKDQVGDEAYQLFKQLDIGDFIGFYGPLFTTKTGEWTLFVKAFTLVCKSTRPLPEKFHGLKDPEKRYRKRYLDLIMNPKSREVFVKRSQIVQSVRNFLLERDFLEVETPMMQPIPGGAEAAPFSTYHNALGMELFLRIAPELYLKRLVVGGFERVFEINRNFRNEGVSTQHNPEFTMLEFYQAYAAYKDLIALTREMFRKVADDVAGTRQIPYQEQIIDLDAEWREIPILESLREFGGVPPELFNDREGLLEFARTKGVIVTKTTRIGKIITKLFDALVEPQLIQPTFITEYPVEVSPLSRRSDTDPDITERFELFIGGREIANGFSELNDPEDQHGRFMQQVEDREAGNDEAHAMDEDYIEALEYGLPPTAGEGIGIDRMVMLFTDSPSIREVIFFPHMKRLEKVDTVEE